MRFLSVFVAIFLLSTFLAACAGEETFNAETAGLIDGQPNAVGVLAFLNDESTTFEVLDREVPLDRRAAQGIIHRRNGPDGVFGTADDEPFTRVEQVLDVSWVGPVSLQRILDYAALHGWVPEGDDLLGVYLGVAFTVEEAEATVRIANTAPESALRHDAGIQARTVNAIMAARPILSVLLLSEVLYVGPVSLERLRAYALEAEPPVACAADADCDEGSRCYGAGEEDGICRHPDELYGVVDGVTFSLGEAEASLILVNHGDEALLRGDVGLTSRAAENIIAAREIDSIAALAAVSQVGPVSLERIRDFARENPELIAALVGPTDPEAGCLSSDECEGDYVCVGGTPWRPWEGGDCADPATLPGNNADCDPERPYCRVGQFCAGLTQGWPWGFCQDEWMQTRQTRSAFTAPAHSSVARPFSISEQASVPLDTVLTFDVGPARPALVIGLENPYGNTSPVWNHESSERDLPGEHFAYPWSDEVANGDWFLHVENHGDEDIEFGPWTLYMASRWD